MRETIENILVGCAVVFLCLAVFLITLLVVLLPLLIVCAIGYVAIVIFA